jgi:cytochrome c2
MWIPAGVVLTAFGLALLIAWISEPERRARASGTTIVLAAAVVIMSSACTSLPHEDEARRLTGGDPQRGRQRITQYGCDSCHTIPGVVTADANVGPPLTRVARRVYLAGRLENTPENMRRWIEHPHRFDERTAMPEMGVTEADSRDIVAYLYTLQ